MANINASTVHITRAVGTYGSPVSIDFPWPNRLAGSAFVEAVPMTGYVMAIALDGPVIAGVGAINTDGSWEIRGIAEKFSTTKLLVLGMPRNQSLNYAIASHVLPVI